MTVKQQGVTFVDQGGSGPGSDVNITGPLGQADSDNSIPVVIASDQSPIPVTGSFSPVGTQDVNLIQVAGAAVTLGQKVAGSSIPVVLPAATVVPVDATGSIVSVTGTVAISGQPIGVSGPLTDTQLRAVPVPVSGTVAISGTVPVSGPLTDTQLRATPVPVSGTVTITPSGLQNVQGNVAHDAAASTNQPVSVSGIAQDIDNSAPPNRVSAENDITRLATDRDGAGFVHPHGPQIINFHENSSSQLTASAVFASAGAGLCNYITDIVISTGAATAFNAFFSEGATVVLGPYYLEAINGRGVALHFQTPKKLSAATALTVTTSGAIAHSIEVNGFIGP